MEQLTEHYEPLPDEETVTYTSRKPNVVIVQLETFFNVNRLKDVKFSSNPLPNLTQDDGRRILPVRSVCPWWVPVR